MLPEPTPIYPSAGLSTADVQAARQQQGTNQLTLTESGTAWKMLLEVVTEPMFILLTLACALYVLLGEWQEGIVLGIAMVLVAGISLFQTVRSDRALQALRQLTQPTVSVVRDGKLTVVDSEAIVVGDLVWLTEGQTVPADGVLQQANDCSVDESVLTGESVSVAKTDPKTDRLYAGTWLTSGSAYMQVTQVGASTKLGKLGQSLQTIETEKTPLQLQISQFVRRMAFIGLGAFALVWGINFLRSGDWATSLLLGLTIAMSVLPEEIPVAFSSFMALGAARMVRFGVLTKQPQTVESLGSATVICTDKTGTITQEGMTLASLYDGTTQRLISWGQPLPDSAREVLAYARWASEPEPFDAMERAIVDAFSQTFPLVGIRPLQHEYPLEGVPPMMTHVYAPETGAVRVAGKGAVERIVRICSLSAHEKAEVLAQATALAKAGYRVLGVAGSDWSQPAFPNQQDDFPWQFKGLVALENPPKDHARSVIQQFNQAGIAVKMITGDSVETAQAIAQQVDLPNGKRVLTGDQVMQLSDKELATNVRVVHVFARMFPEAKLRVIRSLKSIGEVVAMTGDGVNDGPALKAAHIGVAMGRRGSELAKQAASLVLVDDDLRGMIKAIEQGRRIYQNLKQAVGYIVSIHIPIILTVTLPLFLNWTFINLFSPIHVIFLELVMGPTCSIAFENEPAAPNLMQVPPRSLSATFFSRRELGFRVVQGLAIALGTLGMYYIRMEQGLPLDRVRTVTFMTLVLSNCWLTLENRSSQESVLATLKRPNPILWGMLALTLLMLGATLAIPGIRQLAQFSPLSFSEMGACLIVSLVSVGWLEIDKAWFRKG